MIEGLELEGGKEETERGRGRGREREREREIRLSAANRNSHVASLRCSGGLGNELAAAEALI